LLAFLGTSQEEGDEPRKRKRKNNKQTKATQESNAIFIKAKGDNMHECNMMV
jgi:hypothetical protein